MQSKDASVFFTSQGLAFSLAGQKPTDRRWGLKLNFLGAQAHSQPVGQVRGAARVSYFKGRRQDWKTGLASYSQVVYRNVWPGVDLVYSGAQGRLKYSFLVRPGADPTAISLGWQGASGLAVNAAGQLEVSTPARKLRDDAPVSYQQVGGRRVAVATSYSLGAKRSYGFRVGGYDRTKPLVIDPAVLVYSGYIGGAGDDGANNVAADTAGNLYVSGTTSSSNFPATVGPDTSYGGGIDDAFVAKVKPDGSGLVYAGYIGGSGRENGIDIAVDGTGAAYISGSTGSTDFPATGPDTSFNGEADTTDGFLAKVTPDGSSLAYATYIGGAEDEQANNLAVDASQNAYVTGFTNSDQTTFPDGDGFGGANPISTTFDNTFNSPVTGAPDAFVVKVNAAGTAFSYGGYVGGGAGEAGTAIAVDGAGRAYVGGPTTSNQNPPLGPNVAGGFPDGDGGTIVGPDLTYNGTPGPPPQPGDAFVARINSAGTALDYAGYIGGAGNDKPFGLAADTSGNAYVTGETTSTQATFPNGTGFGLSGVAGFDQTFNGGTNPPPAGGPTFIGDAFVAKVKPDGSGLVYATYLGGSGDEGTVPIEVDGAGAAYVSGTTRSTEASFPVANGPDPTYNGGRSDAFVAKLNPAGTGLDFAGYIGGSLGDAGIGVAVDPAGNVYAAGSTESAQCEGGFPVRGGPDVSFNGAFGDTDAFVAKIDPTGAATPGAGPSCPAPPPVSQVSQVSQVMRDITAPVISALKASPKVFAVASGRGARATRTRRRARSTTFSYQLSETAKVRFIIQRKTTGRRVSKKSCRKQTKRNRKRRACVLYVNFGTLSQNGVQGKNKLTFSGRLGRRTLRPGSYRALVVATDTTGNRSRTRSASFAIVRK